MKSNTRTPFLISALIGALAGSLTAQTITPLHRFAGAFDGSTPLAGLTQSSNMLYGPTLGGGAFGQGTIFKMSNDGTRFSKLWDFSPGDFNADGVLTNFDGLTPASALTLSGNVLYGTARDGGIAGVGTVFAVSTDGTAFATPHSFSAGNFNLFGVITNSDGMNPAGSLILSGTNLYGTASAGGRGGSGTIFKLRAGGTNFVTLYSFTTSQTNSAGVLTNKDGISPVGALAFSGTTLYGTAAAGGAAGYGTVYKLTADGKSFAVLHTFTAGRTNTLGLVVNTDGINPLGTLVLSGSTLYGTASGGGRSGVGTVFKLNTDGSGFTVLHHCTAPKTNSLGVLVNSDGMNPAGVLLLTGSTLYGSATAGGLWGAGTIFNLSTDGSGFRVLHAFTPVTSNSTGALINSEGSTPAGALIISANTLYGTAAGAGRGGLGTVFKLTTGSTSSASDSGSVSGSTSTDPVGGVADPGTTLGGDSSSTELNAPPITAPPTLTISSAPGSLVLTWPAAAAGFILESTTSLSPPVVWTAVSPTPAVVNGVNTFTVTTSGVQQYYRLRQ